jgi:outer membrane murein-binding lipoprotein Lpp
MNDDSAPLGATNNCCYILNQKIDELTSIVNKLNTQVIRFPSRNVVSLAEESAIRF